MIRQLTNWTIGLSVMLFGMGFAAAIPADTVSAGNGCTSSFLGFPAWYDGLLDGSCNIKQPNGNANALGNFVWRIVLNVIEIALRVIAYASAGFIIYGGFKYLTSTGLPDKTTAAKKTIQNAVIGLVISFFSVVIVSLIAQGISK